MAARTFRVATRGSKLALAQTARVVDSLRERFPQHTFETHVVQTAGDVHSDGGRQADSAGLFVKEIEQALLDGEADLAVHSLKDMPTKTPDGLTIGAIAEREDARDALISRNGARLAELARGAVVGTGSVRRAAQLRAARPDLRIEPIRGNLDTRIAKLTGARASPVAYDAIVVAVAGCRRLGLDETITEILPLDLMLPAPGQGALAVEVRQDHTEIAQMVASLDDPAARQAVDSERACLRALGGGCRVPIAAMAEASGDSLVLRARVLSADGARVVEAERSGPHTDAEGLGERVASELLAHGAGEILGLIEDR